MSRKPFSVHDVAADNRPKGLYPIVLQAVDLIMLWSNTTFGIW